MARCSICNGDGGMIAVHQACLHDLLEAVGDSGILLCKLCGMDTEACIRAQGTPCRDLFRLDLTKAQALIEEVGLRD